MELNYTVKVSILNKLTNKTVSFDKSFIESIVKPDTQLYDNVHTLWQGHILELLNSEINAYLHNENISEDDIEVDGYEILSGLTNVDIFFENPDNPNEYTLTPTIKAYVHPVQIILDTPSLKGELINNTTILWSWKDDKNLAHYLLDEKNNIIAQLPVGLSYYTESQLDTNKIYIRKLVSYNAEATSKASTTVSLMTGSTNPESELRQYKCLRNTASPLELDDTTDIPLLEAFHSGIGDGKDCLVTKQTNSDFYEKFGLDMKVFGTYHKKKSVYDQITFNYRIHCKGKYKALEQPGKMDLILHSYPIEYITYRIYRYGIREISANLRVTCKVRYYKLVPDGTDADGNPVYVPKSFDKSLTSESVNFSFEGTATFDNNDINNVGFAICDFLEYSNAKTIGNRTLLEIIEPEISSDTEIQEGTRETGIPYSTYDFQVENDYPFNESDNKWSSSGSRSFGEGVRGTLKTSAGMCSEGLDKNTLPCVYGFSEGCLFEIQQYVTHEINYLEGVKTTLRRSEITDDSLVNIADPSDTLSSSDSSIKNVITVYTKERDIVVDTLDEDGLSSIISKCHIDGNGVSGQFKSDKLTYTFSSEDPYTMVVGCYVIEKMDMSLNNDPVTDEPLTDWRPREYMFVPEIISTSGNIDIGLHTNVVAGQDIPAYRGHGYFGVSLFSNLVVVIKTWEVILPKEGTDPLNGIVNGRFDLSTTFMGKKDLQVTMPVFQIPAYVMADTVRYDVIMSDFIPSTGFVSSSFAHMDADNYGVKNADVITFSSDSMFDKIFEYTDLIETIKYNGLEIFSEFKKTFDFTIHKPPITGNKKYEVYSLQIIPDNNNIAVSKAPIEMKFDEKDDFYFPVLVKYQQNATEHWYPRVHNGYYYLNNEEHFLHSEFKADGDFVPIPRYANNEVHYTINCKLRRPGGQKRKYVITRKREHEFIKDRVKFDFDTEKGLLFPKPTLDTKYYKEYEETIYTSSTIVIPETVSICDIMTWISEIPGASSATVQLRSYDITQSDNGVWSDWITITSGNGSNLLLDSTVVQFRIIFKPVTTNVFKDFSETKCCQLDYLDDLDINLCENIRLYNDIIQCENLSKPAIVYSNIFDYGSSATMYIETFDNSKGVTLYVAGSNDKNALKTNPSWVRMTGSNKVGKYRYLRYKINMPASAEIYLLYKYINEPVTTAYVPKIGNVKMDFTHIEPDHVYVFSQEFDNIIPFDMEWHEVAESITHLITPIITEAGYNLSDIEDITIDSKDKTSEIIFDQFSTLKNETAKMIDIFNKWKRFSHNTSGIQPAIPSELTAWSYDSTLDSVVCGVNSDSYIGFISDKAYDKYKHKVNVKSADGDDDIIGVVIAFAIDKDGKEHTLSAIRTSNVSGQDYKNTANKPVQWGIFYDYTGFGGKKLIADGSGSVTLATNSWGSNPNGAIISIQRLGDIVTAKTSQLNSTSIDENTALTIDLNSDPLLKIFKGATPYGYSCYSQNSSIFKDIEFINLNALDGGIKIRSLIPQYDIATKSQYVKFINNSCTLTEIPQQFCPVIVQDDILGPLRLTAFYDSNGKPTLTNKESFVSTGERNFNLCYTEIDKKTLVISLDGKIIDQSKYELRRNLLQFKDRIDEGHVIDISYKLINSFVVIPDIFKNTTTIIANTDTPLVSARVIYETSKVDNKNIITNLSINPIHNLDTKGFIYISYDTFPVYDFTIRSNPSILKADGNDTTQIYINVIDIYGNPVPGETLKIINQYGKMKIKDYVTDENGVVVIRYIAPTKACEDIITVSCTSINMTKNIVIRNK